MTAFPEAVKSPATDTVDAKLGPAVKTAVLATERVLALLKPIAVLPCAVSIPVTLK